MSKFWKLKENYNGDITFGELLLVLIMIFTLPTGIFIGWALSGFPSLGLLF